jgi:nitrite reductase (NADH) small subunit
MMQLLSPGGATADYRAADSGTVRLCHLDELPVGLGRAFEVDGRRIAVFRTRRGAIFALDNRCPHKGGPLAEGMLAGEAVVCPLHAFKFALATGDCDQPHLCAGRVQTFPIVQKEGEVLISLPARGVSGRETP